ncbi:hypothetical protein J5491_03625 [Candidatus Saccharibacteria bacterium]|nr:hypothetical protein [Candidatus Saccharibacteria bacterium]
MDKYVKQSIDARKNAISASYNLDAGAEKKVDAVFAEIEKLGKKCKDATEFEAEFQKSPLNQKYLDLFTEIATTAQPKNAATGAAPGGVGKMVAGGMVAGAAESALNQAVHTVVPTRAAVHQKAYDEARDIPVVGEAIDVAQKASYLAHLGKVFGKKKKEK